MAKSKWNEVKEKLLLIEAWARDGLLEKDIAKKLGISKATMEVYKKEHQDFLVALKNGKEVIDFQVENALLKRALGYTTTIMKQRVTKDGDVVDTTEEIHIPPEPIAQIFWLKNRKPEKWREKQEIITTDSNVKTNPLIEGLVSSLINKQVEGVDESE